MIALALVALAVVLAWPTPRVMARRHAFRRAPRAALVAWQAVTVSAIVAALAAAPAILPLVLFDGQTVEQHFMIMAVAIGVSGVMLARLLIAGHHIGRGMRQRRQQHRELVDIIASQHDGNVRILEHPTPTAYCLPGRQKRVVLSQGVIDTLGPDELDAVLAHEQAHLSARHDLLIEFFSVIHETVPEPLRCQSAMSEVRLLVEALADRASVRRVGELATAQALLALADSRAPEAAMGVGTALTAPTRLKIIAAGRRSPALSAAMYTYALLLLSAPLGLVATAWL